MIKKDKVAGDDKEGLGCWKTKTVVRLGCSAMAV